MLKYFDSAIVFAEFPDEVCLAVNITNCPGTCEKCSEPWLRENIGVELTNNDIDQLISQHPDITMFGLMGGDSDHLDCCRIANYIHSTYPYIKVGMYSGLDYLDSKLLDVLDAYKIGRFISPKGPIEDWFKTNNGVLNFPWSNQLYFEKIIKDDQIYWQNSTYKFRDKPLGDPSKYII